MPRGHVGVRVRVDHPILWGVVEGLVEALSQHPFTGRRKLGEVDLGWPLADGPQEQGDLRVPLGRLHPDLVLAVDLCGDPASAHPRRAVPVTLVTWEDLERGRATADTDV